jgi:hypothetical protein
VNLPEKYHSDQDLELARTKGQVVGWIQGGGAVIVGGILLNLLGWVPAVIVVGVVAWVAYKLVTRAAEDEEETPDV